MRKIPTTEREIQIRKRCEELGHEFLGWLDGHKNKDSKLIIRCKKHGDWNPMLSNYIRKGRCMKCVIESRASSVEDVNKRIIDNLSKNQSLVGSVGEYKNNKTKFKILCAEHGEWYASALHLIHSKSGCPKCGNETVSRKRRHESSFLVDKITNILSVDGRYKLVRVNGEYVNNKKSTATLLCKTHGEWIVDIGTILADRHGCPCCSKSGFKPNLNASLYLLKSLCGKYFKVGISNNADRRITELKRSTPFEFVELHRINGGGGYIREMEKTLHSKFESARMKGFNGATEWFFWSDLIEEKIKQL